MAVEDVTHAQITDRLGDIEPIDILGIPTPVYLVGPGVAPLKLGELTERELAFALAGRQLTDGLISGDIKGVWSPDDEERFREVEREGLERARDIAANYAYAHDTIDSSYVSDEDMRDDEPNDLDWKAAMYKVARDMSTDVAPSHPNEPMAGEPTQVIWDNLGYWRSWIDARGNLRMLAEMSDEHLLACAGYLRWYAPELARGLMGKRKWWLGTWGSLAEWLVCQPAWIGIQSELLTRGAIYQSLLAHLRTQGMTGWERKELTA